MILGEQQSREAKIERAVEAKFARQLAEAERKRKSEIAQAVRVAIKASEAKLATIRTNQEAALATRVAAEREASAKRLDEAVATERARHFDEKQRLETALAELTRKIQRKTPFELGEPSEVALHTALLGAFTEDQCRIHRVPKGRAGPDIVVEVLERDMTIGTVVIDSKNHSKWSAKFVTKLKSDARALDATWAILATNTFPRNERGLCVVDGVIVTDPGYISTLVEMLRRQIVEMHRQRLTHEARDHKAEALLDFVASADCAELLDQFSKISEGLLDLDVREVTVHQTTWRKRGELIRLLQRAHQNFLDAFDSIMNGDRLVAEEASI